MRFYFGVASFLAFLMSGQWVSAGSKIHAETDEAKFVRLTTFLESNPLADKYKSIRSWLINWAVESQSINVVACDSLGLLSSQDNHDTHYESVLVTQSMFGNAAFQITHPDKKSDSLRTQVAGVVSSLKAYSSIVGAHPEARIPHMDDLLRKRQDGTLEKFMAPIITEKCVEGSGAKL